MVYVVGFFGGESLVVGWDRGGEGKGRSNKLCMHVSCLRPAVLCVLPVHRGGGAGSRFST